MRQIHLTARPRGQRIVALAMLTPNYYFPPRTRIVFEDLERLPDEPIIFAMNHTDRYNYWPFQYRLWRTRDRFTATWVKGKYYENPVLAKFMELTNNIPTVSRGYLITRDFLSTLGRRPDSDEYTALRGWVDGATEGSTTPPPPGIERAILERPREVLGRRFDPTSEDYPACINGLFQEMMQCFLDLHREAFDKDLDLIVFPEGTRSVRLSRGHIGLAQIALAFRRSIVPIGCNHCDRIYPGTSPLARGGHVIYRFGEPITWDEMAPFHIHEPFVPFSPAAETTHRERFQGLVDMVMERINGLLDPRHQRGDDDDDDSDDRAGTRRFV